MQRQPPPQHRGLPSIFSVAQQPNNTQGLPPTLLRTLQVKAERTKSALDVLIGYIGFDHDNVHVKNMGVWQELLALYQAVLVQIQELSNFISDPPIRSSSSTESTNPFLTSVVHLQTPISTDQESLDRLEYMVLPSRLAVTRQVELDFIAQQGEVSGWKKEEQIVTMMPQELVEEQEMMNDELLTMKRRMRKAGDIVLELTMGLDWKMRATEEVEEEEEGEDEEGEEEGGKEAEKEEQEVQEVVKIPKVGIVHNPERKETNEEVQIRQQETQSIRLSSPRTESEDDDFEIIDPEKAKSTNVDFARPIETQLSRVPSAGSGGTGHSLFGDSMDVDTPTSQTRLDPASNVIDITDDVEDGEEDDDMEAVGV